MAKKQRKNYNPNYYKGRYIISLYTVDDEFVTEFDNVNDLALDMGFKIPSKEFNTFKSRICNCFKKKTTITSRFFRYRGRLVRPFLIDMFEDQDDVILL